MKYKSTPTQLEQVLPEDKILVSKTDSKGIITYANPVFLDISGYTESQLLGQPQNIVRHPDMPRVIFRLLWETLQNNREFNGYIKNLAKDGSYYWFFANITSSFSADNKLLGYTSARRKPDPDKLNYIQNLYSELLEIEQQSPDDDGMEKAQYKLDSILNSREKGYDEFVLTI
ncbi:MAG: PAS domain-containing protein [Gammaproteobacteria bacterium]|nr:PAS domain-containing protein [Gammaproteobacteria bacterium]